MNRAFIFLASAAVVCAAASSSGQNFTDLNFESAQIIPASTNANGSFNIATANALPGWSAFSGTAPLSVIAYNTPANAIAPPVSLLGGSQNPAIEGNFNVLLHDNGSITQTALVPAGTQSLRFDVAFGNSQPFTISLDGQDLFYSAISSGTNSSGLNYSAFGGNISAYAGQVETLTFSTGAGSGGGILDNIQFSTMSVPEPSTISRVCLSGGLLIRARRRLQVSDSIP